MPSRELTSLMADAFPGGRIIRTQRLRGGISAFMRVVTIECADGSRKKVSVRRLRPHDLEAEPWGFEYEFGVLRLLQRHGIFAPRPLYLDAAGKHFGDPALVMSFLPGRLNVAPLDTTSWTDALAVELHKIHSTQLSAADRSLLRPQENHRRIEDIANDSRGDPFSAEIAEVLRKHCDRIEPLPPTLLHNDYWAGNTIWNRGRLTGVIDWTHTRLGDPRNDVSECRGALVFDHDEDAAHQFLAAYERHAGRHLRDIWFFDLLRAVIAYLEHDFWLEGLRDLGIELEPAHVKARLAGFLRRALDTAKASA